MWRDIKWAVLLVIVTSISCNLFTSEDSTPEIPGKLVYSAPDKMDVIKFILVLLMGPRENNLQNSRMTKLSILLGVTMVLKLLLPLL